MTANISRNPGHGDSAEHFLYDPETDAYLGFVRVDKATDLRVTYLDETASSVPSSANGEPYAEAGPLGIIASADDPRWIAKLVTDAHATVDDEIAHLLYRATEASSHQEQLALSQLAAAKIAFQQLIESHYPRKWATGQSTGGTWVQVTQGFVEKATSDETRLAMAQAEIHRQKDLILSLDKRVADLLERNNWQAAELTGLVKANVGLLQGLASLNADNDALVVELEKHEEGIARLTGQRDQLRAGVDDLVIQRDKAQAANDRQRDTILAVREAVT